MHKRQRTRDQKVDPGMIRLKRILAAALALGQVLDLRANPQGMTVANGNASVSVNGSQLTITASHNSVLNWQSFNIAAGETTSFNQPSAASVVWNRINDSNPSQIWGHINANGIVVLMNQSGFFFGPGSVVNAAGFVATTASVMPELGPGGAWQFNGPPPLASIVNYGEIKVNSGGSAFLIAEKIENHGMLSAPDGTLGLYAGKYVLMSERPDGRGLSVNVELPEGSIDNQGKLAADGGSIFLHARSVNQNGIVQANSIREHNGVIELIASDSIKLGADSVISAKGDDSASSSGGKVLVKSDNNFTDVTGSLISIAGGTAGGNGGSVELSAPNMDAIHSVIDGHANGGSAGGTLLIDPLNITLGSTGSGSAGSGTVNFGDAPASGTLALNVNSAFVRLSQIHLQAQNNITVLAGTIWDLATSTGLSSPGCTLTLEAGNDLIVQNGAGIRAGTGWSVSLSAGRDFTAADLFKANLGNITLQGTGFVEGQNGSLSLHAGKNVTVGSGFIRTMAGGSIDVAAISGSVNTGTKANGFQFSSGTVAAGEYISVDPNLGGISTAAGGNVNITAGQDITSFLPSGVQTSTFEGGAGAFGAQAGNVNLNAGGNITGHYVVRNGLGTINAGLNAGTSARNLALSLVSGGWNVIAGQNILLQEVRNPNGIFNSLGLANSQTKHYFDFASDAFVSLNAANSVQLRGGLDAALPRRSATFEQAIPSIYAPSLEISAGAGGIQIANDIRLFPSATGQLNLQTTGGGSLTGLKNGDLVNLIMSDSSHSQFNSDAIFGADDHAAIPLHLNDSTPVTLDIAGDMTGVLLTLPKRAEINIGGNMINSRFSIQNLHANDVTSVNVAGDIVNRNEFTSVALDSKPSFLTPLSVDPFLTILNFVNPDTLPAGVTVADLASLANKFSYDAANKTITFQGRMTSTELQLLTGLQVQKLVPGTTIPVLDANGEPVYETISLLNSTAAATLFAQSQDIPLNPNTGYVISGPGALEMTARNVDLGATRGIQSVGAANNSALAALGNSGASIDVALTGNLDMFSTTISSIAGGDVTVFAGGRINVGSTEFTGNDSRTRGIFTVAQGDVSVAAGGDINVNGSRIGAYDGGDVFVKSLHGNVDAGKGAGGTAEIQKVVIVDGQVQTDVENIPYSGIFALSWPKSLNAGFPDSQNAPGDIRVETPEGNIVASSGGILQLSLNHVKSATASLTLIAGTKDADGNVTFMGSIDAGGSGIIGNNVNLEASDGIHGLVVAQHDINITAQQNVNVTAIGGGNVGVSAGGAISGTIVGVGSVSAAGNSIDASLLSQNVSASGNTSSAQMGFAQGNAASAASQAVSATSDEEAKKAVASNGDEDNDEKKKKGGNGPALARRVGRVTVILPKS